MWWKSLARLARPRHRPDHALREVAEVQGVRLVSVGLEAPDRERLVTLAAGLERAEGFHCYTEPDWIDAGFAFEPSRNQYYATQLLRRLGEGARAADSGMRILGVCALDLFVPILTFVFGEAQLSGPCAIVSYHRLAEPGRPDLEGERLLKEAVHELGHTYGLRHCDNWECAMASSSSVERLDLKSARYCVRCREQVNDVLRSNNFDSPTSGLLR